MKRSQVLAVTVVALMMLSALPAQPALAATPYTEKLNVYIAGSSALWYFTFGGINGSSKLTALESSPGLSWYNITAIKTGSWLSDFQVFGPRGYNLLPVPFIPSQGLFLTVGSDTFADASGAASALGSYLLTSFTSLSNGTGTYSFYSPVAFTNLMPNTLLKFLPSSAGGFSKAITSALESTDSPFVVLEGRNTFPGFSHALVVGSIATPALDSNGKPSLLSYFGSSLSSLAASNHSSSSVIQMRFLDGVVKSTDSAVVSNDNAQFSGSYTLSLAPGKKVTKINATVAELPVPLLATRTVDKGVLQTNDDLAVTITLRNLATAATVTSVRFSDSWWNTTGSFKFLGGNFSAPKTGIAAGGSITPVYRLQYTGTTPGNLTIPASVVRYSYSVGGQSFNATAVLNPIRLSLGADDAVLVTTVQPSGGLGKSVGAQQSLDVTVTNVGTQPASSVVVAGHSISGLAAKTGSSPGGSATVTLAISAAGLTQANSTASYAATYQDSAGHELNATSNVASIVFSHASMKLGFVALDVESQISTLSNQVTNLTLSFATSNLGPTNVTSFRAVVSLPAGLGCGSVSGKPVGTNGVSCSGGRLTIAYPLLNASSALNAYMKYNLTGGSNFYLPPFSFSSVQAGENVTGMSNPVAVPAGLVVSKGFTPARLFGGMGSTVAVEATNVGGLKVYNASVATTIDSFDALAGASSLTKSAPSIAAGGNLSLTYSVTTSQVFGNLTGAVATSNFYFGATSFTVHSVGPTVQIYQPLGVSIYAVPSTPTEGRNFTIGVQVTNPSGVSVSNVLFTLPVPSGLGLSRLQNASVSGGVLTFSVGTLAAHSSATATASAVASSGITIPFARAALTFQYAGTTINGILPSKSGIAIGEDVTTRYVIPTAIVLLALLVVAFYVRRQASASAPASQK